MRQRRHQRVGGVLVAALVLGALIAGIGGGGGGLDRHSGGGASRSDPGAGSPGDEIFLEVGRISSGATGVAYGFHDGRLVPAGPSLSYNGDSGVQAGFDCVSGSPPRLIQRYFAFIGPNEFTRSWREHEVVYAWHGPTLIQLSVHSFKRLVALKSSETHIGRGCIRGVS